MPYFIFKKKGTNFRFIEGYYKNRELSKNVNKHVTNCPQEKEYHGI